MRRGLVSVTLMVALLAVAGLFGMKLNSAWALPPDTTYNVGIVDTGDTGRWQMGANNLGEAMGAAPGVAAFVPTLIPTGAIASTPLSGFDVLVVPSCSDRSWVTSGLQTAIANFVQNGGILIIGPGGSTSTSCTADQGSANEPLVGGLPATHRFSWAMVDWCGTTPDFPDPTNPVVTFPNMLTPAQVFECDHDSVNLSNLGSAFRVAVTVVEGGGGESPQADRRGPIGTQPGTIRGVNAYACGPSGKGAVVFDAHHQSHSGPDFHLLFENLVRLDEACQGVSATATATATATPAINNSFILGAVGSAASQQARQNREATDPSRATPVARVAPPSTGAGPVISAPNTGDAGLKDESSYTGLAAIAIGLAAAGATLLGMRRARSSE